MAMHARSGCRGQIWIPIHRNTSVRTFASHCPSRSVQLQRGSNSVLWWLPLYAVLFGPFRKIFGSTLQECKLEASAPAQQSFTLLANTFFQSWMSHRPRRSLNTGTNRLHQRQASRKPTLCRLKRCLSFCLLKYSPHQKSVSCGSLISSSALPRTHVPVFLDDVLLTHFWIQYVLWLTR